MHSEFLQGNLSWMVRLINKMCHFGRQENPRVVHEKVHHAPRIRVWVATQHMDC
jgi:hypothetical protein